jgi:multiple sugar transport system substrate-binding protein
MRNWPYAYALMEDPAQSKVAGRFAVAPMPPAESGTATAALGGSALAINAHSDRQGDAYRLIDYLLQPEQMLERARVAGQLPTRRALYETQALADALTMPLADARAVLERAVPRPVTPVYNELSGILQIALHRALTGQEEPRSSLREAAASMRALLTKVKLGPAEP